ncbi:MAG TPA: DUF3429 domain-containing protein [Devosiaceae bacterium]|nr:DUF3429 domain-containing protein [Devosiaceae bacterium]
MSTAPPAFSRIITLAAIAGLAPFVAGLVLTLFPSLDILDPVVFERALLGYGALILSFLGGVRWGIRMQGGAGSDLTYLVGIGGSVLGFLTLLMPYGLGLTVLIVGFGAHGAWDVWGGFRGTVPRPYARLRSMMTWLVCAVLLAILAARALL